MTSSFEEVHYQYTDAGNKFVTSPRQQLTTSVNCPNETLIVIFELVFFCRRVKFKNKKVNNIPSFGIFSKSLSLKEMMQWILFRREMSFLPLNK